MTDFVVVGGGIAGVSAAAHLAPLGSVVLLEKEPTLAYHTSGRSAAMLVEAYGSDGARPLVKAARPFLENPPEGSVDAPLLSDRALMWIAPTGKLRTLERLAEEGHAHGSACVLLSAEETVEHFPGIRRDWVEGGLYEPAAADIDVAGLHQAYVRLARRHGAAIVTGARVTSVERTNRRWSVETENRVIEAGAVINAAGAWGDGLAEMAGVAPIGLQPMRRTAFMVPGSHESADWPMIVEANEQFYVRPDGVQFLCSLAEETPSEPTDARPRMEDVALAIDRINRATTFHIRTVNSQWAGLRTFAPDRELVIGEDPLAPGFYWLVGQGGTGIQTSPAYGRLLTCLVTGAGMPDSFRDAGVDPDRTSPARFR